MGIICHCALRFLNGCGLHPFKYGCCAHAAADAHGNNPVSALYFFQVGKAGGCQLCTGAPQWMAQCNNGDSGLFQNLGNRIAASQAHLIRFAANRCIGHQTGNPADGKVLFRFC